VEGDPVSSPTAKMILKTAIREMYRADIMKLDAALYYLSRIDPYMEDREKYLHE
jgi:hypothetical protein